MDDSRREAHQSIPPVHTTCRQPDSVHGGVLEQGPGVVADEVSMLPVDLAIPDPLVLMLHEQFGQFTDGDPGGFRVSPPEPR